jgi:hypothetical protein
MPPEDPGAGGAYARRADREGPGLRVPGIWPLEAGRVGAGNRSPGLPALGRLADAGRGRRRLLGP